MCDFKKLLDNILNYILPKKYSKKNSPGSQYISQLSLRQSARNLQQRALSALHPKKCIWYIPDLESPTHHNIAEQLYKHKYYPIKNPKKNLNELNSHNKTCN